MNLNNQWWIDRLAFFFSWLHSGTKLIFYFAATMIIAIHIQDPISSLILIIFLLFKIKDFFKENKSHKKKFLLKDKTFT